VVTLFVPMNDTYVTQQVAWNQGYEVPDLSLPADIVRSVIDAFGWELTETEHKTGAGYGHETMLKAIST